MKVEKDALQQSITSSTVVFVLMQPKSFKFRVGHLCVLIPY